MGFDDIVLPEFTPMRPERRASYFDKPAIAESSLLSNVDVILFNRDSLLEELSAIPPMHLYKTKNPERLVELTWL